MLISRHGYYTGLIFKGYANGYSNLLASGGRYDNLTEKFGVEEPAVGFALEIENLLDYLNRTENFSEDLEKRFSFLQSAEPQDFDFCQELGDIITQGKEGLQTQTEEEPESSAETASAPPEPPGYSEIMNELFAVSRKKNPQPMTQELEKKVERFLDNQRVSDIWKLNARKALIEARDEDHRRKLMAMQQKS